jgi:hypothetical protein
MESLYIGSISTNAFELFFEPVSNCTLSDAVRPDFTYYPPTWKYENVTAEDTERSRMQYRDLKSMMESDANVVVSDVYYPLRSIMAWIRSDHWAYGKTPYQIYRVLYDNYLRIKPEIKREIQKFINTNPNFRDERPILGVHVRGDAIVTEVAQIYDLNELYKPYIWQYIVRYNVRHLFLITDSKKIARQYKRLYGVNEMLISSDSKKMPLQKRIATCLLDYPNKRHKGVELLKDTIEVIKDTYLASQCDFFIGNGYSSLSNTVLRLKDWSEMNIKLLY